MKQKATLTRRIPGILAVMLLLTAAESPSSAPAEPEGWSIQAAHRALNQLQAHPPSDTNALVSAMLATGEALELALETNDATRIYTQVIEVTRAQMNAVGLHSPEARKQYINALLHLGGLAYSRHHYEGAGKFYGAALETAKLMLPQDDPMSRITRNRYALAFGQRYQLEERKLFLEKLRASCLKAFGPDDEETALVLDGLVEIALIRRDYKEMANLAAEALRIRRHLVKPDSPRLVESIIHLASADYELGRRDSARALLNEVLRIRLSAFGPGHPATLQARQNLEHLP